MLYVYDIFEGTFSTGDAREIELGKRVMSADDWENGESWPLGRTDYEREQSWQYIAGNAARAETIAHRRKYERTHPGAEPLDHFLQRMAKEIGE
jgi:hypothetical protein